MKGNCTRLSRYAGNVIGWQSISNRVSISGPSRSRETVEEEVTLDCSTNGGSAVKKKSPGTQEIGDIEVEVIWNPSDHTGTQQVTTATAAGTATSSGNMTATVTGSLLGSAVAVPVAITTGDTASVWAGKVRAALAASTALAPYYEISGTGTAIVLRVKITGPTTAANDATLNLALTAGTTGITTAATSAATTAGVAGPANAENHHLFEQDFDSEVATFWRIVHRDTAASGILVHATVKELGEPSYQPNQTVKRTFTLEPTGEFYLKANDIEAASLPNLIIAPQANWGRD